MPTNHPDEILCPLEQAPVEDSFHVMPDRWQRAIYGVTDGTKAEAKADAIRRHNEILSRNSRPQMYTRIRNPAGLTGKRTTPLSIIKLMATDGGVYAILKEVFDISNPAAQINEIADIFYDREKLKAATLAEVVALKAGNINTEAEKAKFAKEMLYARDYVEAYFEIILDKLGVSYDKSTMTEANKVKAARWLYSVCGENF